jgi:hypothetical protein
LIISPTLQEESEGRSERGNISIGCFSQKYKVFVKEY